MCGESRTMTADARRLGEATKYTASEATNLQIELSKLGFSKTEILDMKMCIRDKCESRPQGCE